MIFKGGGGEGVNFHWVLQAVNFVHYMFHASQGKKV